MAMTYHISELLPEVLEDLADRPKIHTLPRKTMDRQAQDKQNAKPVANNDNPSLTQAA